MTGTSSIAWRRGAVMALLSLVVAGTARPQTSPADLTDLRTPANATAPLIGASAGCKDGFLPGSVPQAEAAAPLPAAGGMTFSAGDERRWAASLDLSKDSDGVQVSDPGDRTRIRANALRFIDKGEEPVVDHDHERGSHGMKARDAAFYARVRGDAVALRLVGDYLVRAAADASNDFTSLCFRLPDNSAPFDAYYEQAAWLLRYLVTYDYARRDMAGAQRLKVENYIRRQAYFFAAHLDWNLSLAFPRRLAGDYTERRLDALPRRPEDAFATKRFDTNGDCKVDSNDDPTAYPVHAWVDSEGTKGPRISRLSQWFNNRKSAAALAFGAAGVMLGDAALVNRAKRYVMEWLTFSVYPDGSEGEYFRNGDYCIARQGLIYSQYNIQAAAFLAHWLRAAGDDSLLRFGTTEGLFGTEVRSGDTKTIARVIDNELRIVDGRRDLYYDEPWRQAPMPREATRLGKAEARYMNSGRPVYNQHMLGLLMVQESFPGEPLQRVLLRGATDAVERSRGERGSRVATGYGQWQDVFGALPAVLVLLNR